MYRQTCDILITNTSFLDETYQIQKNQAIAVHNGTFKAFGDSKILEQTFSPKVSIDGTNKLWIPGLTDGHMHTAQQLLRGGILDELPMIWTRIMLPFESTLTPMKMHISAQIAALEMIKSGTTSFVDAGGYFMDTAARVYLTSGLRGALSHSTMDTPNLPHSIRMTTQEALDKTDSLYDEFHNNGLLQVFYSLRSLISCSPNLMEGATKRALARKTRVQAHMNEYPNEINFFLEHHQMRPIAFLDKKELLGKHLICAHGLFVSDEERQLLKENKASVVCCPFSNSGKHVPNIPAYLQANIPTALGTDGTAHGGMSLFNEIKILRSLIQANYGVPSSNPKVLSAISILQMLFEGGASLFEESAPLGKLKQNYTADFISINLNQPHLFPSRSLTNTLIESVNANDVQDMIVNGKLIMKNREVLTLDEEKILSETRTFFEKNN